MTGLLTLPAKSDGSMGRVKATRPDMVGVSVDPDYYETAAEREAQKTAIAAVCEQVGLADGSTAGSLQAVKAGFAAGSGMRALRRNADGTFTSVRINESSSAPGTSADGANGYVVGSTWTQIAGYPGPYEGTPAQTLWVCLDNATGAAVWVVVRDPRKRLVSPSITSSQAITAGYEIHQVNTTSGAVVLTLPNPTATVDFAVKKTNTGTNGITLRPHDTSGSGPTIEGGSAGADLLLEGSDDAARGYWFLYSDGANWWVS